MSEVICLADNGNGYTSPCISAKNISVHNSINCSEFSLNGIVENLYIICLSLL